MTRLQTLMFAIVTFAGMATHAFAGSGQPANGALPDARVEPRTCLSQCVKSCTADGTPFSTCVPECRAECG